TFSAYYRVSTIKQTQSGWGLLAQRGEVLDYIAGTGGILLAEYQEEASGARLDRPELAKAVAHCQATGAVLAVSHVDRLTRSAELLPLLDRAGVAYVACDKPGAGRLEIYADVLKAEEERQRLSIRTRQALAKAKARGVRLGCPLGARAFGDRRGLGATEALRGKADAFAEGLASIVLPLHAEGLPLRKIAERLNAEGIVTAQGKLWQANSVKRLIDRLSRLGKA
ncbi:MAG: recombinase family protein, partial [Desulfovibrio sp.]|nr:recombinase family protein [Desulfovibrio sp.]